MDTKWEWSTPMLATLAKTPPTTGEWVFERKLDGLRCICIKSGGAVQLLSRNQLSFNLRFPEVVAAVEKIPANDFVIDGELVAFDENDGTSFSSLQRGASGVQFHVFDIVGLLGENATKLSLEQRKALVHKLLPARSRVLKRVDALTGDVESLLVQACAGGWEGLIAKRADSLYRSGRSPDWLKLKCTASQELVIGGWTEPKGARMGFGALLMGYFADGAFVYAGKVGTGFDSALLQTLHKQLQGLEQSKSPFGVNSPSERSLHWAKPQLVANIGFAEWTRDGHLRHPTFQGLRPDKAAESVVRES